VEGILKRQFLKLYSTGHDQNKVKIDTATNAYDEKHQRFSVIEAAAGTEA
jgi:hypothetical protein